MTSDALLVLRTLFTSIWALFTSWYIPGTKVTPMAMAFFVLAGLFLLRVVKHYTNNGGGSEEADEIVTYALDPITSANTTGLKSVLLGILGPYENIVTEYRYMNNNQSYYSYLREITPDYPWFGSLAVFLVLLFSVFRIGGNLLWKK